MMIYKRFVRMKTKNSFLLLLLLWSISLIGQNSNVRYFEKKIDNESANFDIGYVSGDFCMESQTYKVSKEVILIDLSWYDKYKLSRLTYSDWIFLLNNNETDYSTNIILYSIFEKDASILNMFNTNNWRALRKNDDIIFWKKNLQGKVDSIPGILQEK